GTHPHWTRNPRTNRICLACVKHRDWNDISARIHSHASHAGAAPINAAVGRTRAFWVDAEKIAVVQNLTSRIQHSFRRRFRSAVDGYLAYRGKEPLLHAANKSRGVEVLSLSDELNLPRAFEWEEEGVHHRLVARSHNRWPRRGYIFYPFYPWPVPKLQRWTEKYVLESPVPPVVHSHGSSSFSCFILCCLLCSFCKSTYFYNTQAPERAKSAAPIIPACDPKAATLISATSRYPVPTILTCMYCRPRSRNRSDSRDTPPPSTMSSGSNTSTTIASPKPSQRANSSITAMPKASPALAAATISSLLADSRSAVSKRPRSSAAVSGNAVPEA